MIPVVLVLLRLPIKRSSDDMSFLFKSFQYLPFLHEIKTHYYGIQGQL